jgi:23S rRNA (guanosine2251-2'-O)-methyltransferase
MNSNSYFHYPLVLIHAKMIKKKHFIHIAMTKKTEQTPTDLIYGIHPIVELLKAKKRKLRIIYTTKPTPKAWQQIEVLLPKGMQIQYVDRDVLTKIAGSTDHQGVVAYASPMHFRSKFFDPQKERFLLMLDGIQDPRNLGAILRSAYCTNCDGVILIKRGGVSLTPAALKASAGLAEYLDIFVAPSIMAVIPFLKKAGYHLYLAVLQNGENALNVEYQAPMCLAIGSEGTGITQEVRKDGALITLPQRRGDISYNASVAAGILLFHTASKLKKI